MLLCNSLYFFIIYKIKSGIFGIIIAAGYHSVWFRCASPEWYSTSPQSYTQRFPVDSLHLVQVYKILVGNTFLTSTYKGVLSKASILIFCSFEDNLWFITTFLIIKLMLIDIIVYFGDWFSHWVILLKRGCSLAERNIGCLILWQMIVELILGLKYII